MLYHSVSWEPMGILNQKNGLFTAGIPALGLAVPRPLFRPLLRTTVARRLWAALVFPIFFGLLLCAATGPVCLSILGSHMIHMSPLESPTIYIYIPVYQYYTVVSEVRWRKTLHDIVLDKWGSVFGPPFLGFCQSTGLNFWYVRRG